MSTRANIRWATLEDARAIAAVHIASWRAAYRGLMPDRTLDELTVEGRQRDWQEWLAEEGERRQTLVAERDGKIEAFCTLEMPSREEDEPEGVAGIPALYAHPDAFGRGAGPALMDAAIEAMRERGYRESILWVLEGNRRAEAFYERRGWKRDGGARAADYPGVTYASEADRPLEVRFRRSLDSEASRGTVS
jgi:ribosomal protein S18 acetylase RimI-like enzyme